MLHTLGRPETIIVEPSRRDPRASGHKIHTSKARVSLGFACDSPPALSIAPRVLTGLRANVKSQRLIERELIFVRPASRKRLEPVRRLVGIDQDASESCWLLLLWLQRSPAFRCPINTDGWPNRRARNIPSLVLVWRERTGCVLVSQFGCSLAWARSPALARLSRPTSSVGIASRSTSSWRTSKKLIIKVKKQKLRLNQCISSSLD